MNTTNVMTRMLSVRICLPLIACISISIASISIAGAQNADPVLYFTDLTSGPNTGNSDASSGRTPDADGAIVTVWGVNLGASQGTSTITCNGAEAASYYSWGNAASPSDLSTFHGMQMIAFQVNHLAADGTGEIRATVNGRQSNPLPFTVRSGRILFTAVGGDDASGDGRWSTPFRSIQKAASSLAAGDIAYMLDGVADSIPGENDACVNLDSDGTVTHPKALAAYPGAAVRVGSETAPRAFWNYDGNSNSITTHWVIAKFRIRTREVGVYTHDDFRVVGNWLTAPQGDGMDGTINIVGTDVFVYGNELVNCGSPDCDKLYHAIYGKGIRSDVAPRAPTESNRDIGWNYIHDCLSNRAINIYSEQEYSSYIERHRVHDNVIVNQRGDGIMLGYYVTGDNWIYNNLLIRAGLGPEWAEASYHCGIRINTGHENVPKTDVHCYNNTLYACGFPGALFPEETGHLLISPEALQQFTTVHLANNILCSTSEPYVAGESTALPAGDHRNCWFGNGSGPAWDNGAINADPRFANSAANNFRLSSTSPCINSGHDVTAVVPRDLAGRTRVAGAVDLGVFEYDPASSMERQWVSAEEEGYTLRSYPNPFRSDARATSAVVSFDYVIPVAEQVLISVYSPLGEKIATVVDGRQSAGSHTGTWDARRHAPGIYFARMQAGATVLTRAIVVLP